MKMPAACRILIVDDEEAICDLLQSALTKHYRDVVACQSGAEAYTLIEQNDYDVIITDLRLPDTSGLDILGFAKTKDPYTEVVMLTGYASLETATLAVNMGAASYIDKPVILADFLLQIEKCVASRLFHMKSISLMQQSNEFSPEVRDHLTDITSLYYFTRKLTLSLEISEIMRITLEETLRKSGGAFCAIAVNVHGFSEIYAMPCSGDIGPEPVKELFLKYWETAFPLLDRKVFEQGVLVPTIYKGKQGRTPSLDNCRPVGIPMIVTGTAVGTMTVFLDEGQSGKTGEQDFLFIISSIVSSLIDHGYAVLQARQLATTDGLTGIANHRSFHETLSREIARTSRNQGTMSLIVLDIDDFKKINDTYGHMVGDTVLKDIVCRIRDNIRTIDAFARYGGEEFGIILPDTGRVGAEVLARRITSAISSKPLVCAQHTIRYTASLGIAFYLADQPVTKDELIANADAAMYASKRAGKNRYTLHQASI